MNIEYNNNFFAKKDGFSKLILSWNAQNIFVINTYYDSTITYNTFSTH